MRCLWGNNKRPIPLTGACGDFRVQRGSRGEGQGQGGNAPILRLRSVAALLFLFALFLSSFAAPARAADPIRVGFSMALTGSVAQNGKQLIIALELWRDDVNANGGLLGRPVELVYYDDQSNPTNVPGIYTKLITVDKVDLLLGPYATTWRRPRCP